MTSGGVTGRAVAPYHGGCRGLPCMGSKGQHTEKCFFMDPILPLVLSMDFAHGFGCDGFWSMVLCRSVNGTTIMF